MYEYEIKAKVKFSLGIKELWQYRELAYFFTWRDIKVKYKQAVLGILWAILQPLVMMLMLTLIFKKALGFYSDDIPYPLFVMSGLLVWNIFSNGLINCANSMTANAQIIKKIYFPRMVVPISSVLTVLIDFLFALLVFTCIVIYYKADFKILNFLLYFPLAITLTTVTTFGAGIFLAALNIKYRDFQYIIPFMIQFLLFVNPVFYSVSKFNTPIMNFLMQCNPVAVSIQLCRSIFSNQPVPVQSVLLSSITALIVLFIGIYTFRKTEAYFADIA